MGDDERTATAAVANLCSALHLQSRPAQHVQLAQFLRMLEHWNSSYNLTAVRDADGMLKQHLADCLAIIPSVSRRLGQLAAPQIMDVGSGSGLPGVVMAVMLTDAHVTCIDKVGKKAAFVRQVGGMLNLRNLTAEHTRVEQLDGRFYDLITARAFSSLADLTRLTANCLAPEGVWAAMKGKVPTAELTALDDGVVSVFHVEQIHVPGLDAERCLIWMRPSDSRSHPACASS